MAKPPPKWFGPPASARRFRAGGLLTIPAAFAGTVAGALLAGDSLKYGLVSGLVASVILCGLAFAIAPFMSKDGRP